MLVLRNPVSASVWPRPEEVLGLTPAVPTQLGWQHLTAHGRTKRSVATGSMIIDERVTVDGKYMDGPPHFGYWGTHGPPVFTFARWKAHKSTQRYWRHLRGIFDSRTANNLVQPIAVLTATTTLICLYQQLAQAHLAPWMQPWIASDLPFTQTSFALSLLMVFRTDASYSRWKEALTIWDGVRSTSKELVLDIMCWIEDPTLQKMAVRWVVAYCHALAVHLKPERTVREVLGDTLGTAELDSLVTANGDPHYCLQVLAELVKRTQLCEMREGRLLSALAHLNCLVGSGEKLICYPLPLSYTRHTSRFMLLWLGLLPLALWDDIGWLSIPVIQFMSYLLLGIEEIGVQIEEPFSMLPLKEMAEEVGRDVASVVASRADVTALVNFEVSCARQGQ